MSSELGLVDDAEDCPVTVEPFSSGPAPSTTRDREDIERRPGGGPGRVNSLAYCAEDHQAWPCDAIWLLRQRVAAGAAFLDEHDPDWWRNIDVAFLDLSDCQECVLGQLNGGYGNGLINLGLDDDDEDTAIEYGFAEAGFFKNECGYAALTTEWERVITGRRAAS